MAEDRHVSVGLSVSDPLRSSLNGFISEDPVSIGVQRPARTDDGAGGVLTGTPTLLDEQRVRLVRESSTVTRSGPGVSNEVVLDKYVVVGHDNLDIATDDYFDAKGRRWRVKEVWDGPYRSRRAEVIPLDYDV